MSGKRTAARSASIILAGVNTGRERSRRIDGGNAIRAGNGGLDNLALRIEVGRLCDLPTGAVRLVEGAN
jgi:hypothetical protein